MKNFSELLTCLDAQENADMVHCINGPWAVCFPLQTTGNSLENVSFIHGLKIVYRVAVTNIFLSDVSFQPSQYFLSVLAFKRKAMYFPLPHSLMLASGYFEFVFNSYLLETILRKNCNGAISVL